MSDQQQVPGESSARGASANAPDAEAIAASLTGGGKPRTTPAPEGGAGAAASEPAAGAGAGARSTEAVSGPETGAAASGAGAAAAEESRGERARDPKSGAATGGNGGTGSGGPTAGNSREASGGTSGAESSEVSRNGGAATGGASAENGSVGNATAGNSSAATGEATAGNSEAGEEQGRGAAEGAGARRLAAVAAPGQGQGVTATAAAGAGGDSPDSDEGGSGRPRKPVLAGAAMAGAILIAVPLLVMATGKDDEEGKVVKTSATDTVLDQGGEPAGAFVAEKPSPTGTKPKKSPSPTETSTKAKAKAPEKASAPTAGVNAVQPHQPSNAPNKPKEVARKKVSAAAASLPAVLTRVLIKNNTNSTCVDIPTASGRPDGPVHQSTCNSNSDDNQLWNVEKRNGAAGPGGVPLFQIRNVSNARCLDLPGTKPSGPDTRVKEAGCTGTTKDNQLWWLDKRADGKFWIRNAASRNMCLDAYGPDENRRELLIWPCAQESRNNHEWIFTRS
ncbi:RICIN domain-containing protein [Streptomyces sp. NPDC055078]